MAKRELASYTIFQRVKRLFALTLVCCGLVAFGPTTTGHQAIAQSLSPTFPEARTMLAYDVNLQMDEARKEKTIEHYGEGVKPIVEDATKNNENKPDSKETAENSYQRESKLNDLLPKKIGDGFSKEDLSDMER